MALNGASSLERSSGSSCIRLLQPQLPCPPGMQANFKGFTFVDESSMDEHMQGIGRSAKNEDDDMDEDEKRDQDWEDPFRCT